MDAEKRIDFDPPLEFGGERRDFITLREPTIGDVMEAQKKGGGGAVAEAAALIALVSGVRQSVVERMPIRKFKEASDFLAGFTEEPDAGRGPGTGGT